MDPITTLKGAIDQTGRIVAGVKPDQLSQSTPCADWDVKGLLNHTIAGLKMFDDAARAQKSDMAALMADQFTDDPSGAYETLAASLKAALDLPGVMEQTWDLPFGAMPGMFAAGVATVEALQHGWDIARATGQNAAFDAELTEAGLAAAQMMPAEQIRQPNVYGPEAPVAAGAPAHDRLAAFLGRQV